MTSWFVLGRRFSEWCAIALMLVLVALVYQQVRDVLEPSGMAEGGPYDNAAAYPRGVAMLLLGLVCLQIVLQIVVRGRSGGDTLTWHQLVRPAAVIVTFGLYLGLLGILGFHLASAPMLFAIMVTCGSRQWWKMAVISLGISLGFAWFFESQLDVVLPGGIFNLNIPW
ncbi:tripartite tricarboxylate transporter TctB family protein [Rhizobium sp. GN54]|uniref:tripartite tricarboxylate transporter TctB family protein n=1 Tax=Rhizobium sp. GN54 TaxID=2898150 RepID=UPI001E5F88EC|nr:tripartite tricarboxylate transporter TctB family protein [Rhizobium sp. GN54]MCD2184627.1 tripartite tricarboxylate transporter TctB family protein [Rhizobium sp. GN54]